MNLKILVILFSLPSILTAQQSYPIHYSNEQVKEYLNKINLDNWDTAPYAHFSFTHMCELFPCQTISAGKPLQLEKNNEFENLWQTSKFTYREDSLHIDEILKADNVSAYIIIYNGKIIYEKYPYMDENTLHSWMSVTKPVAGAIIAVLADKQLIDLQKDIDYYIPELKNSVWEGTTIENILYMQSGISEDTTINSGETYKEFERSLGWAPKKPNTPAILQYIKQMKRVESPGNNVHYQDANLILLSLAAEKVTGKKYAELIEELIWKPMGAQFNGFINSYNDTAIAGTGMNSTLRDLALFGTLFTYQRAGDVISKNVIDKIVNSPNGMPYMWDFITDGGMLKGGFGKQFLYVNPELNLVVAQFNHPQEFFTDPFFSSCFLQMIKRGFFK